MAVAAIFLAPTIGGGIALSKRAQNRRKQAAANEYSKKYPLADSVETMDSYIQSAETELKNIKNTPAQTAGAKRVKQRNSQALSKWITVMKEQKKDLAVGINVASTTTAAPAPVAVEPLVAAPAEAVKADAVAAGNVENVDGTESQKKGVNWVLIAGVAVGAIILYKILKNK